MIPSIIIPDTRGIITRKLETREEFLKRWEDDYQAGREVIEPPRNIRFHHNPNWRNEGFFSIQRIRTSWWRHPFWLPVGATFFISWIVWDAWYIIKFYF